jgi:hypothetical protein
VFRELKLQQDRLARRNPDTDELIYYIRVQGTEAFSRTGWPGGTQTLLS